MYNFSIRFFFLLFNRLESFTSKMKFKRKTIEKKTCSASSKWLYHNKKNSTARQIRFTWKITTIVLVVKCKTRERKKNNNQKNDEIFEAIVELNGQWQREKEFALWLWEMRVFHFLGYVFIYYYMECIKSCKTTKMNSNSYALQLPLLFAFYQIFFFCRIMFECAQQKMRQIECVCVCMEIQLNQTHHRQQSTAPHKWSKTRRNKQMENLIFAF